MGKLRPVGSEKLQGMDKINRILEIAKYKENVPTSINENSSVEYQKTLADGNQYHIIKERMGYVIKKGLNESIADYIEPMKSRKYYPSYSQALKRLNLIVKEVNNLTGRKENLSLFNEGEKDKYFLKYSETNEQAAPAPMPAPAPAPMPAPAEAPPAPAPAPDYSAPEPDVEMEDMCVMPDMDEPKEEKVSMKSIQKLTGKLTQKIRAFAADEENEVTSNDMKYVINSVLSAFDLNQLDEEDREEIMAKFEPEEESEESSDMPPPSEGDEMPEEPLAPPAGGEMAEYYPPHNRGARGTRGYSGGFEEGMRYSKFDEIFSESKVDKVLSKYFDTPKQKNNLQKLSERKLVKKYPHAKYIGKSVTNNLIYEINNRRVFIKPNGNIL
jgi:hypothetical protein